MQEVVRGIKRSAAEHPNAPPSAIFRDEVANVNSEEVIANLPQRNDIIRNINRIQNRHRPNNPMTLQDLNIEAPYTRSLNGQQFLQYDSGSDDVDRFIVFYTTNDLERLCNSRMILGDGTFKTVPSMFFQMYTFHGIVNGYTFPLVYCISTRKTESFYRRLLIHLQTHANELRLSLTPQIIMSDFELSFINAARAIFPNAEMKGCLFHFTQSVWRQAVLRGLKSQYLEENSQVRVIIQKLLGLPFIPVADVLEVFDNIVNEIPDDIVALVNLTEYIERTYIRGRPARGRRPATFARFPPNIWSVYSMCLNGQYRSNNAVEGWHSRFQRLIVTHHSGIWKFLEHIRKDQRENEVMMIQLNTGHTRIRYPVKGKYKRNQEQIEVIVGNYEQYKESNNIHQYLKAISYKIKLNAENTEIEQEEQEE